MPSSATITAFYSFTARAQIRSSEVNANFNNFRGHLVAIDPNTATAATTNTYDLGATDRYWRALYATQVNCSTVSTSSIVATTVTATDLNTGSLAVSKRTVSTTDSLTASDCVIYADAGSAFTITFPAAASHPKKIYIIKKTDSSFNAVTLSGTGMTTNYLMTVGETVWFQSDGTNWVQISRKTDTDWISYTPTGNWSTNTTYTGRWRRDGPDIIVQYKIATSGAPDTATASVRIPNSSSWTIDTTKLVDSGSQYDLGFGRGLDSGVGAFNFTVKYSSTNSVEHGYINVGSANNANTISTLNQANPMTFANGDTLIGQFRVPITNFSA